jgi:L-alanine-DL-glutamate epimerase-like enolase superfamily enzyme
MSTEKQNTAWSRRRFFKQSLAASAGMVAISPTTLLASPAPTESKIWITDLRCAIIKGHVVIRIVTNTGVNGYAMAEYTKLYLKPFVMFYKDYIVGMDPTDVSQVMMKIRRMGSFKPWGAAVSAIEIAMWDIAGKVAGVPVYKLLGGKVRSKVRVYSGGGKPAMTRYDPAEFASVARWVKEAKEGYTIAKFAIAFHSATPNVVPDFYYGAPLSPANPAGPVPKNVAHPYKGVLTTKGMKHIISCVEAIKGVLGDDIGLALDLGPGHSISDSIRLAKALEPMDLLWMEDLITGDYTPYVMADLYRDVTMSTTTPIHTGEQIYLREHFKELFEKQAVRVIGPDPADVGGISELKWVAEYADLHGIQMAPHGVADGLLGLAALVQVSATMPENYIAFEYPMSSPEWYEMVEGLPDPIVTDGHIAVWDRPGMGVDIKVNVAKKYLSPEDKNFFD